MSIKLTSSETGRNRSSVAAAVGTSNKISIAPATVTHILNFPTAWSNVSVGAVDTTNAYPIGGGAQSVEITDIFVTDSNFNNLDDTAISTSGGFLKLIGIGFQSGAVVYIQGVAASSTTYVSPTELRVVTPVLSSGTLQVYVVNPDNSVAIRLSGIVASGTPAWVTVSPLAEQFANVAFSIQLLATSDSTVAYSLDNGSSLPGGVSLTTGGLLSGTIATTTETTYSFTLIATDLEFQDTSKVFSVTVSIGDIYLYVTPLLLKTNNSTWITDTSANKLMSTVVADAKPSAFSPFNTNWSTFYNGTSDYITVSGNNNLAFGTNDFTIECFFNANNVTSLGFIYDSRTTEPQLTPVIYIPNATSTVAYYVNGSNRITSGTILPNRWYHLVVSRVSGSTRMFLDGVQAGSTYTDNTNYINGASRPVIGTNGNSIVSFFNGFISNLRVLNGTGTAAPTVPTSPLSVIANTQLLVAQDNRFIDESNNAYTITKTANTSIKAFGPFSETDLSTGSAYFDGTGDYVLVSNTTSLAIGTTNFTIEFWYYLAAPVASNTYFMDQRTATATIAPHIYITPTQYAYGVGSTNNAIIVSLTPVIGTWAHLAVSRTSSVTKMFLNGQQIGSNYTDNNNYVDGRMYIGSRFDGSQVLNGHISNFRFVNGSSVYSANTTISSTPLGVVSNTALLTLKNRMGDNTSRFIDESGHRNILIRNGNITQSSFSPFSQSGYSAYFDGTGDYLSVANSSQQIIGTKDFTVEGWVYLSAIGADIGIAGDYRSTSGRNWLLYISSTGTALSFSYGAGLIVSGSYTFQRETWYHLAATRSGSTLRLFVNGTQLTSATVATNISSNNVIIIGGNNDSGTPASLINGYISNFRFVIGTALYTANTTIQSNNLTAVTNTVLLTCQSNRFIDNSTANSGSGFLITPAGQARAINYSPFKPTVSYDPSLHGSSFYLDGSGDFLNIASNTTFGFGTSDWHIEFWVYPTSSPSTRQDWIDLYTSGTQRLLVYHNGTNITLFVNNVGAITGSPLARFLYQWTHIAVSKVSGSTRMFINGQQSGATYSDSQNYGPANPVSIGKDTTGATHVTGYMSDIILLKGRGLYTNVSSNIVPTSPLSISNKTLSNSASLLLTGRNSGIYDATGRSTLESNNDVKVSNTRSKFADTSIYFDGNGDSLKVQLANSGINFGTTDFTIEFWLNINSFNGVNSAFIYEQRIAAGTVAPSISASSSNTIFMNAGSTVITGSALSTNTWYHIAASRYSGNTKLFINGTQSGSTYADTNNYVFQPILLGSNFNYSSGNFLNGYIEDLRITNYARYSNNFTAPGGSFFTR